MQIEHLKYMLAVIDYGSMNSAAKALYCTQPTLTNAIKSIEKELGYAVIQRSPNGTVPTERGRLVISDARFIVNRVHDWKKYGSIDSDPGNIDVVFSGMISSRTIFEPIFNFQQANPSFNIRLIENHKIGMDFLLELQEHNYRFALYKKAPHDFKNEEKFIIERGYQVIQVQESQFAVFINSENLLAKKEPLYLKDIQGERVALYRQPEDFPYIEALENVDCNFELQVGDSSSVILAVAMGQAIAIRPIEVAENNYFVNSGRVTVRHILDCPMPINLYLIYPRESNLSTTEKLFVDHIKKIPPKYELPKFL